MDEVVQQFNRQCLEMLVKGTSMSQFVASGTYSVSLSFEPRVGDSKGSIVLIDNSSGHTERRLLTDLEHCTPGCSDKALWHSVLAQQPFKAVYPELAITPGKRACFCLSFKGNAHAWRLQAPTQQLASAWMNGINVMKSQLPVAKEAPTHYQSPGVVEYQAQLSAAAAREKELLQTRSELEKRLQEKGSAATAHLEKSLLACEAELAKLRLQMEELKLGQLPAATSPPAAAVDQESQDQLMAKGKEMDRVRYELESKLAAAAAREKELLQTRSELQEKGSAATASLLAREAELAKLRLQMEELEAMKKMLAAATKMQRIGSVTIRNRSKDLITAYSFDRRDWLQSVCYSHENIHPEREKVLSAEDGFPSDVCTSFQIHLWRGGKQLTRGAGISVAVGQTYDYCGGAVLRLAGRVLVSSCSSRGAAFVSNESKQHITVSTYDEDCVLQWKSFGNWDIAPSTTQQVAASRGLAGVLGGTCKSFWVHVYKEGKCQTSGWGYKMVPGYKYIYNDDGLTISRVLGS